MAMFGEGVRASARLVEVKAVSENYPLRGSVRIAPDTHSPDVPARGIPASGDVWIDASLAALTAARAGDFLSLGQRSFRIAAILTLEPDRGVNFSSVASRLVVNLDDLESTRLIQPGSRVVYRLLVAGEGGRVQAFREAFSALLGRGERIEDARNARPEMRNTLDRAQKFLGLAALLSVVLAAVSVALAARRYMRRHLDACAVMRCLGAKQGFLLRLYSGQFVIVGFVASLLGCVAGYLAHFVLYAGLSRFIGLSLPPPGFQPVWQGVSVGLLLLAGFALPPVFQLKRVPAMRVLRREFSTGALPPFRLIVAYAFGFFLLVALMFWVAGEARLGGYVAAGFSGAAFFFALAAFLTIRLLGALRGERRFGWRYGLASLNRRAASSVMQIVALGLGFMALILLTATRSNLLESWREALPPDAPNRFVINIQPDQIESVRRFFAEHSVQAEFSPMVRGRLARINGIEAGPEQYGEDRARRLVEREFNLSYREDLPEGNAVTEGRWLSGDLSGGPFEASIEAGLAKSLKIGVGDRLEFSIAGESIEMRVIGIRKLKWDSMRVNFFVLTQPSALQDFPASWITAFYLAPSRIDFVGRLVREYPNLTVIDVAAIVSQMESVMGRVSQAVQFVFLFTLFAGVIVLWAALASAAEERRFELAVMRVLGARREQLRRALLAEFALTGGIAGLIASVGATAVGRYLAEELFQFEAAIDYPLFPLSMFLGALAAMGAGWFAASRLIDASPSEALRAGG